MPTRPASKPTRPVFRKSEPRRSDPPGFLFVPAIVHTAAMRIFWFCFGLAATGLGIAGAILPLLPATPFFLLAAFGFARSSPRLHAWLTGHRRFGPLITDWQRHGAIARRAKVTAIMVMLVTLVAGWAAGLELWLLGVQAAAMAGAATFILTRPEPPPRANTGR